jgi:hypothetical protein
MRNSPTEMMFTRSIRVNADSAKSSRWSVHATGIALSCLLAKRFSQDLLHKIRYRNLLLPCGIGNHVEVGNFVPLPNHVQSPHLAHRSCADLYCTANELTGLISCLGLLTFQAFR